MLSSSQASDGGVEDHRDNNHQQQKKRSQQLVGKKVSTVVEVNNIDKLSNSNDSSSVGGCPSGSKAAY